MAVIYPHWRHLNIRFLVLSEINKFDPAPIINKLLWSFLMFKRKSLFVTFEGTEGSGKSYQCKKLYNKLKKIKLPVVLTREPGGTKSAEKIRNVINTKTLEN